MKQKRATLTPLAGGRYRCNWPGCKVKPLKQSQAKQHRRSHNSSQARPRPRKLARARLLWTGDVRCPYCGTKNFAREPALVTCRNTAYCGKQFIAARSR